MATKPRRRSASAKATRRHTWIIAMTANAMNGDREQCLAAGHGRLREQAGAPRGSRARSWNAPRDTSTAAPAIDPRSLEELRELSDEDGAEHAARSGPEIPRRCSRGRWPSCAPRSQRAEPRAVALAAHALKGSSGHFGAHRLQELCGEMESAGKAGNLEPFAKSADPRPRPNCSASSPRCHRELELQPA